MTKLKNKKGNKKATASAVAKKPKTKTNTNSSNRAKSKTKTAHSSTSKLKEKSQNLKSKRVCKKESNEEKKLRGRVYRANTKYIDKEPKKTRRYVVVKSKGDSVTVAKLKSIKKFDENGKNADIHLKEIDYKKYGLEKRTGVDNEVFNKNRIKHKPLSIKDRDVFVNDVPEFKLSSRDLHSAIQHTNKRKKDKT